MKITTAKEFMQVIAKHYETCKEIYLHTMYNIPLKLIDGGTARLYGLPEDPEERQGVAIMHAIFAALTFESGEQEHTVVKDILPEVYEKFGIMMATENALPVDIWNGTKIKKMKMGSH